MMAALAIALTAAIGACGGKVVVDEGDNVNNTGGLGGAGGGLGGAGGDIGASFCFTDPPNPASLSFCGGSVGAGGSTGQQCENDWCDEHGNTWTALCGATTCQCMFNGMTQCTCALDGPGNFCVGTPTCCPLPGAVK